MSVSPEPTATAPKLTQPELPDAAPGPDADAAKASQNQAVYLRDYTPPAYTIDTVDLYVDLHEDHAMVTGTLNIQAAKAEAKADLWLHGESLELVSVTINGTRLTEQDFRIDENGMLITHRTEMAQPFVLETVSRIRPQDNTRLEGLYRSKNLFCTQCEAEGFRSITWFLDRPDVMATYRCTIEADREKYPVLLSNGNLIGEEPVGENRHRAIWEDPFRKPSYLFALVAGTLDRVEDSFTTMSGRNIDLHIYVDPGNSGKCRHALDSLKKAMRWDEERYGREYDLDLFNIVAVDDFNMGAMENKSLNIFNSSCVLADTATASDASFDRVESIVAHEYFHNWSGNRVTCRDWFQLSLKEGFTVYRDACFSADMHSPVVNRIEHVRFLRTAQFAEDAGPMAHAVRPESYMEISNFYTLTIYEKGAEVVRMIHLLLGDELFRRGSDLYFDRFDGQAVTTEDFVACMEEVSDRDLSQFKLWYSQAGTPCVKVKDHYNAKTGEYRLTIRQHIPDTPGQTGKQPMHFPFCIGLVSDDGKDFEARVASESTATASVSDGHGLMIELRETEETVVFKDIAHKPVVSLNRGFSAPVRVEYDYDTTELLHLMQYDSDGFNRWNAGQILALSLFDRVLGRASAGENSQGGSAIDEADMGFLQEYATALKQYLKPGSTSRQDPAFCALLLQMPEFSAWIERLPQVDIQLALGCYEQATLEVCSQLEQSARQCYDELGAHADIGQREKGAALRALRNTCLGVLSRLPGHDELAWQHFDAAKLMTDQLAGFRALLRYPRSQSSRPAQAIEAFEHQWQQDSLVMDNWFGLQAASRDYGTLEDIERLSEHRLFSRFNPNKLRSLFSTFAGQNWACFHATDGAGYRFIRKTIAELDQNNPQIASRMATPLTRWRKYAEPYSSLLKAELSALAKPVEGTEISKDLYEIVYKSLQETSKGS
ncbi:aminopeptidase N [Allohahella marinimesophila]|uniref:Aminopeptidase N n=1 Tax=Allohahella marinimesophila TaxID=1054972 RepID=A0ABP7NKR6_9GAMM